MDRLAFLAAVIIVTFIIQLLTSVTMIARMVLIIIIRIRTIKLGRVIVTATEIEIVAIISDHDSRANSTSKRNGIKPNTSKKNEGSNSTVSSIGPSTGTNHNNLY